jgi:hypothetical protein
MSQNRLPSFGILDEPVLKVADNLSTAKFKNIVLCHPFVYRLYSDQSQFFLGATAAIQPTSLGVEKSIAPVPSFKQLIDHMTWDRSKPSGLISTSLSLLYVSTSSLRKVNVHIAIIKFVDLVGCAFTGLEKISELYPRDERITDDEKLIHLTNASAEIFVKGQVPREAIGAILSVDELLSCFILSSLTIDDKPQIPFEDLHKTSIETDFI